MAVRHAGEALWNLNVLVHEMYSKAENDPVVAAGLESCRLLSEFIKVPLPDQAALEHLRKQNQLLRGVKPAAAVPAESRPKFVTGTANEALDHCRYILGHVDEIPDKGEEFAESVRDKTRSIQETITKSGTASENQITALENMRAGLDKWLRRD